MQNYGLILKERAISNLWMNPHVDKQFTIEPNRLTLPHGFKGALSMPFGRLDAPVANKRFIAYNMGSINPRVLGLAGVYSVWRNLAAVVEAQNVSITVTAGNKMFPLSTCWIQLSEKRELFLTVEVIPSIKEELKISPLRIKFYSNAWFNYGGRKLPLKVSNYGGKVGVDVARDQLLNKWDEVTALGYGFYYTNINGVYHDTLTNSLMTEGDFVEIVFDGASLPVFDVKATELSVYKSVLHGIYKALVMTPDGYENGFVGYDDIDIFVYARTTAGGLSFNKGFIYPRQVVSDLTQVTWQDWGLDVDKLADFINKADDDIDFENAYIRVVRKNNTGPRERTLNSNATKDLFLLPFNARRELMVKPLPVVSKWLAANLESSVYNTWLTADVGELNSTDGVYNYYGTRVELESSFPGVNVDEWLIAPTMYQGGLAVKYGMDGLLSTITSMGTSDYSNSTRSPETSKIDLIPGANFALPDIEQAVDTSNDTVSEWDENRYFFLNGKWNLATAGVDYTISGHDVSWRSALMSASIIKQMANRYIYTSKNLTSSEIGLGIDIGGTGENTTTGLGFGNYDVWLGSTVKGSRRLINGVDFVVDFPKIYITNKAYVSTDAQLVTIVAYGILPINALETGFVEHGLLSTGNGFKLHLNRNKRFFIDGVSVEESDMAFSDGYSGENVTTGTIAPVHREGALYAILDTPEFISPLMMEPISETRSETDAFSAIVETQLSSLLTEVISGPVVIPKYHAVVSIYFRKLLDDILNGTLVVTGTLSDGVISSMVLPYKHYLEIDILTTGFDSEYMTLSAHAKTSNIGVTSAQFNFLKRVDVLNYKNEIDLSENISIV